MSLFKLINTADRASWLCSLREKLCVLLKKILLGNSVTKKAKGNIPEVHGFNTLVDNYDLDE